MLISDLKKLFRKKCTEKVLEPPKKMFSGLRWIFSYKNSFSGLSFFFGTFFQM
jgi:hypothetical protein